MQALRRPATDSPDAGRISCPHGRSDAMHSRPRQCQATGESFQPEPAEEGFPVPDPPVPPGFAYRRRNLSGISRSPTCGAWSVAAAWVGLVVPVVVAVGFRAADELPGPDGTGYRALLTVFVGG